MTGVDDDWIWTPTGLAFSMIGVGRAPGPPTHREKHGKKTYTVTFWI